jgi:alkane 1-monooxygenase
MFLLSLVPSLWFRVMDPILLAHAERNPARIHFDPKRREELCARYGLEDRLPAEEAPAMARAAA